MAFVLRPPGSTDALSDKLADLGVSRKRVALAAGVCAFLSVVLGLAAVAGFLDAWLHLPPLVRALALVLTLTAGGVMWLRGVTRVLALRTDPLAVALELEEKHPALNDALASAVSFLRAGDAEGRGVSQRLQFAAVRSALRLADRLEFERLVPTAAFWRAGWGLAIVMTALVPLTLADTERATTALVRLADPFGHHPWPTKTRVEIVTPEHLPARMPKGEPFDLKFVVRGVIKDRATVSFRLPGDEFSEDYPLSPGNDPQYPGAAVVVARIDPARLPTAFTFRVTANDCETDWQQVDVVPPPRLVPLDGRPSAQFHVTPPAYTGLPPTDLPDGTGVLEVPVGTVVRLRAATDVRLSAAVLAFQGDRSAVLGPAGFASIGHLNPIAAVGAQLLADSIGSDIPLSLDPTGHVMTGTFTPALSGMYALRLTDETGLLGTRLIEFRLVPDPAPAVNLLRPSPGRDPAVLAPTASLPIHLAVTDKLYSVRSTFLEYRVGRDGPLRILPLNDLRDLNRTLPAVTGGWSTSARVRPTFAEIRDVLPLAAFTRDDGKPLRAGDTLILRGAADDWDDMTPVKQPGRTEEVEIRIALPDAIEAWLQRELAGLRPDLLRLRDQQREATEKTAEVVVQPDGTLSSADRDRLLAAEQSQRQIRGKVSDPRDGLRAKADLLRETLRANAMPRSTVTDRVEAIAEELGRLADRDLPVIEPYLSEARQLGGQNARPGQDQNLGDLLKKAGRHQKAIEDGLTNILDLLSVWGGASDIRGESRLLRDLLNRLAGETEKLTEKVPTGQPLDSLNPAQRIELDRIAGRTELAAEQTGSLLARAARLAAEKDKQAADARAAAAAAEQKAGALRAAAEKLAPGNPEKSNLNAQASLLQTEADDLRAAASRADAEASALRKGIEAAGGQALPEEIRRAADAVRNNRQTESSNLQRSAAGRLERLADALTEKPVDTVPELAKLRKAADDLDALGAAQDDLRKRTEEAARIPDPAKREAELKKLVPEQEKLMQKTREVLQRLTRERADAAARDTRSALDRMEAARDDLERGDPGLRSQNEAVEKLDNARDRLDATTASAPEQLSDEKRRKLVEKVNALLERQKAAVNEADRIHALVRAEKKWERPLLVSYADLEERERAIAVEVRVFGEKEFAPLPVLARLLAEAAAAMDTAADKAKVRREDALDADPNAAFDPELEAANDRKVSRPMTLALRRLQQLADALRPDDPKNGPKKDPQQMNPKGPKDPMNPMSSSGGGEQDLIPPLAQLKVLRALQAELNERTAEFAKAHPEPNKLTDEQREELKELEQAQRDIAALFEQMAKLFEEHQPPKSDKPPTREKTP